MFRLAEILDIAKNGGQKKNVVLHYIPELDKRLDICVLLLFHFGYQEAFHDQKRETDDPGIWLSRHNKNCDREY